MLSKKVYTYTCATNLNSRYINNFLALLYFFYRPSRFSNKDQQSLTAIGCHQNNYFLLLQCLFVQEYYIYIDIHIWYRLLTSIWTNDIHVHRRVVSRPMLYACVCVLLIGLLITCIGYY